MKFNFAPLVLVLAGVLFLVPSVKLLAKGESLDPRDKGGMTPLHKAILGGHAEAALLLIEHGADVAATNDEGAGAITFACMKKLEAGIAQLREILADPGLYARDPARFDKASTMLAQAETDLASAEDRWLELEMLREAAGG